MGASVDRTSELAELEQPRTKIPRPVPGGSYSIESLGRWVDRLMGDTRARRGAGSRLEPLLMREDEDLPDPEAVEIPPPVPGGAEPITRDDRPDERR